MQTDALKILDLEGGPAARGHQHGEILRAKIHDAARSLGRRPSPRLSHSRATLRRAVLCRDALRAGAEDATRRPSLDEVRAIAEGADVDYRTLLALQHVNEEFWLALPPPGRRRAKRAARSRSGRNAQGPTLIGQNLDLDAYLDGFQILLAPPLAISSDGPHSRAQRAGHDQPERHEQPWLRGLRQRADETARRRRRRADLRDLSLLLEVASRWPKPSRSSRRLPHASGLNWVMGDPAGVAMYERSAGRSREIRPRRSVAADLSHQSSAQELRRALAKAGRRGRPVAPICGSRRCTNGSPRWTAL